MSVSIYGSGNVAWHLAQACISNGIKIDSIIGRNTVDVNEIATISKAKPITSNKFKIYSDILIIAVADNAIENVS